MIELTTRTNIEGLKQARRILSESVRGALTTLGPQLQASVRGRTRFFKGEERRGVKWRVRGRGLDLTLDVYAEDIVQAVIDEMGLAPGHFPRHRVGSRLYKWTEGKGLDKKAERKEQHSYRKRRTPQAISHLRSRASDRKALRPKRRGRRRRKMGTAPEGQRPQTRRRASRSRERAIEQASFLIARTIYEKGIKPTQPFSKGLAANQARVIRTIQDAVVRAVTRINRGG